jgi:LemA protein
MELFVAVVLATLVGWAVWVYNRLVRLRNQVRAGWSDIDVQLTRRHDLVGNLVEAVRGYAGHESALLLNVTTLRSQAMDTASPERLATIEAALEQAVGRLFALREAYPDLKASENFLQLQRDLVAIEDHLQYARRFYNGAVRELNDGIQRAPDLVVARAFGFEAAEFYQAAEGERAAPSLGGAA